MSELRNYRSKVKEYEDLPEHHDSHMPTLGSKIDMEKELSIEIGNFRAILKQLQQQTRLSADVSRLSKTKVEIKDIGRVIATIPSDYENLLDIICVRDTETLIRGNNRKLHVLT